ncbi:hypothetical protein Lal_00018315 [Lupinus albus]|uniref:Putative transcription factor C2C2-CO-like family n=1 Tax=Lupinus albus TaxID=3870 RepID=A0A6A4NEG6_LUPAL|nr:putative transcription factor C2C2-CO-like family [Lupinus albus]KAF1866929.1 hypothetical protein Lal_00018315 [Lupinus albus]
MPLSPSSMASTTHFYPNYTFTNDFSEFPTQGLIASLNGNRVVMDNNNTMWGSQDSSFIPNLFDNNGALDHVVPHDFDTMASSSCWMQTFPDFQLGGFSELANTANNVIPDCKMSFYDGNNGITGFQNLGSRYQQPHIGEFVEEYCGGFVEDIKPPSYPNTVKENWGFQGNQLPVVDEPNIKVGRYSEEERKERILRYLKKRNQRNFNKTIKYACRKTLADRRVRVRGRFARNNELCEEDVETKRENHDQKEDFYGGDTIQFQIKNDDEDWLQEAMASLVYLSHSSPEDM